MSVAGTWKIRAAGRILILRLNEAGGPGVLEGDIAQEGGGDAQKVRIVDGRWNGNKVHWAVTEPVEATFDGEVSGKTMTGEVKTPWGSWPFEGTLL